MAKLTVDFNGKNELTRLFLARAPTAAVERAGEEILEELEKRKPWEQPVRDGAEVHPVRVRLFLDGVVLINVDGEAPNVNQALRGLVRGFTTMLARHEAGQPLELTDRAGAPS